MVDLKNRRVLVVGTGISGIGSATLLEEQGAIPLLYDSNENAKEEGIRQKLRPGSKAEIKTGAFTEDLLENLALAVLSPGVPTKLDFITKAKGGKPCTVQRQNGKIH